MTKRHIFIFNCLLFLTFISKETRAQNPLFPNSVVSNDIDFIIDTDSDTFTSLTYLGLGNKEMPGAPNGGGLFDFGTFIFNVSFSDNETLEIWCHSTFLTQEAAQEYANKLCPRLGKLPVFQRNLLNHVVIHNGDGGAFAEIEGQFFILYSENMDARISTNDLEETVFHESVHASYQFMYENDSAWIDAQAADAPAFVTEYGQDNPDLEDMAESALFAYTYIVHPGRLSAEIETWLEENIPNRLDFFRTIYFATTHIGEEVNPSNIRISPNPANDWINIKLSSGEKLLNVQTYDYKGRLVYSSNSTNLQISVRDFGKGLFFFLIMTDKGTYIEKIIVVE